MASCAVCAVCARVFVDLDKYVDSSSSRITNTHVFTTRMARVNNMETMTDFALLRRANCDARAYSAPYKKKKSLTMTVSGNLTGVNSHFRPVRIERPRFNHAAPSKRDILNIQTNMISGSPPPPPGSRRFIFIIIRPFGMHF